MSDNLMVLGIFCSKNRGLDKFVNGFDLSYPAAGVFANKQRTVFLDFGGCVRVQSTDSLIVEVTPHLGCMNPATVNTSLSFLEFYANPAIGYELCIPTTSSQVVQQNTTNQPFSLGNNITKITFVNLDKPTYESPVISTVTLSSDKLDRQLTYNKLLSFLAAEPIWDVPKRYGTNPPAQSVFRIPDLFPQTIEIYNGGLDDTDLDSVRLDITFNGSEVAVSKNYVVYRTYMVTAAQLEAAAARMAKHVQENIAKKVQA
jgi:hypothetical protein